MPSRSRIVEVSSERKVALLRGVNVAGKNKLKMADLRDALQEEGLADVATYIQSGNILFNSEESDASLEQTIAQCIAKRFGYEVPVLVRSDMFFQKIVDANPMGDQDTASMHVTVLSTTPSAELTKGPATEKLGQDTFTIVGDVVYVLCPNGYGKTRLTNAFFESKLQLQATTRNWKTINKLIELSAED